MANPEHVEIVKQGAEAIREWSGRNPEERLDLSGANLTNAALRTADLSGAGLNAADLTGADLAGARFVEAVLVEARLTHAILGGADLRRASLSCAFLNRADLRHSILDGADLFTSDLTGADLGDAKLRHAMLTGALLSRATLRGTDLSGTDFSLASCDQTVFADLDLSKALGLERIAHFGPSTVGIDTLYKSKGKIPDVFLRRCGVPENLIAYMRSLTGGALDLYSCFISFAEPDDAFSERLYNDLQVAGVRCWHWREDAKWGTSLMREVDSAIRVYDKLIVICSETSLRSEPMIREIERALQKEQRDGREVLFPIRLDDYVFKWDHALQADVVRKNVGDFRNWTDPAAYDKALARLIRDLQAKPKTGDNP